MEGQTAYILAKSKMGQMSSGFDHSEKLDEETIRIYFIDGSHIDTKLPKGNKGDKGDKGDKGRKRRTGRTGIAGNPRYQRR